MTQITIRTARWADAQRKRIEMTLDGVIDGETIPFHYNSEDTAPVTLAVKQLLATGDYTVLDPE